jgi:hypothetical protein
MRGGQLAVEGLRRRPASFAMAARARALCILALHQRDRLVPDAGQRLAEIGIGLERGGVDGQQVEDLAGDIVRI